MISILIKDTDSLFMEGMKFLFNDVFADHFNESVKFLYQYNIDNISQADVIVLSLCQGERYTCFPELQARKKGIILGLVREEDMPELSPSCFSDIMYVSRKSSLNNVMGKVITIWNKWLATQKMGELSYCLWCKHRQMSEHQFRIMEHIHQGKTIKAIAKELEISSKTIYTHKYLVMHKFNLRNDSELKYFLDMLMEKENISISFRQRVVR